MIKWLKSKMAARRLEQEKKILLKYIGKPTSPEEKQKQLEAQQNLKVIEISYDPLTESVAVQPKQNIRTVVTSIMILSIALKVLEEKLAFQQSQNRLNQRRIVTPR